MHEPGKQSVLYDDKPARTGSVLCLHASIMYTFPPLLLHGYLERIQGRAPIDRAGLAAAPVAAAPGANGKERAIERSKSGALRFIPETDCETESHRSDAGSTRAREGQGFWIGILPSSASTAVRAPPPLHPLLLGIDSRLHHCASQRVS